MSSEHQQKPQLEQVGKEEQQQDDHGTEQENCQGMEMEVIPHTIVLHFKKREKGRRREQIKPNF